MNDEELLFELRILRDETQERIDMKRTAAEVAEWRFLPTQLYRRLEALKQLIVERQYKIDGPRIDGGKCSCCLRGGEHNGQPCHCICHD